MAVQKVRKSRSKRDMRRAHDALAPQHISVEKSSGEMHLRHNVSPNGYYRGKKVIEVAQDQD